MSNCCINTNAKDDFPKNHRCPINGKAYNKVTIKTILHHIKKPWARSIKNQGYYFCDDPECNVVYFGQDNSVIEKSELRTVVGIKTKSKHSLLCYCFGISSDDVENSPESKTFIIKQTKEKMCACNTRNPSGRCCLKDFPKS